MCWCVTTLPLCLPISESPPCSTQSRDEVGTQSEQSEQAGTFDVVTASSLQLPADDAPLLRVYSSTTSPSHSSTHSQPGARLDSSFTGMNFSSGATKTDCPSSHLTRLAHMEPPRGFHRRSRRHLHARTGPVRHQCHRSHACCLNQLCRVSPEDRCSVSHRALNAPPYSWGASKDSQEGEAGEACWLHPHTPTHTQKVGETEREREGSDTFSLLCLSGHLSAPPSFFIGEVLLDTEEVAQLIPDTHTQLRPQASVSPFRLCSLSLLVASVAPPNIDKSVKPQKSCWKTLTSSPGGGRGVGVQREIFSYPSATICMSLPFFLPRWHRFSSSPFSDVCVWKHLVSFFPEFSHLLLISVPYLKQKNCQGTSGDAAGKEFRHCWNMSEPICWAM